MAVSVRELMTRKPEVMESNLPIREAIRKMKLLDIRHIPILNRGELAGILSDRDLRIFESLPVDTDLPPHKLTLDTPVSEIMSSNVITVEPEADVLDVIDAMVEQKIGAIPVVDPEEGTLVGIISYIDVLKEARRLFE